MKKYLLLVLCVLLAVGGCSRKWNNPVESAVPLPGVPGLISPANNVWIWNTQNAITFAWSKVDGATKYKLLLSNYSNISDSFVVIEIADTFYNWLDTNKLGKLYWQVKAWNPINEWKVSNINVFEKGPYAVSKCTLALGPISYPYVRKISNDYLYIFNSPSIGIVSITDIKNPKFVKNVPAANTAYFTKSIFYGSYMFCCGQSDLVLYDISDPLNPQQLWSASAHESAYWCMGAVIRDTILISADAYSKLRIYNIANIISPVLIDTFRIKNGIWDIALKDSIVMLAQADSGISLVNIANVGSPYYIKNISSSSCVTRFIISSNILYCESPLQIYNIADPSQPNLLYSDPSCNNWNTYITSSYIIYWDYSSLKVNDILTNQTMGSYVTNANRWDYYQNYAYFYSSNVPNFSIIKCMP